MNITHRINSRVKRKAILMFSIVLFIYSIKNRLLTPYQIMSILNHYSTHFYTEIYDQFFRDMEEYSLMSHFL